MSASREDHPLAGVSLKLRRARQHLRALERRGRRLLTPERSGVDGRFEPPGGEYYIVRARLPAVPPDWGAVVGDVLHNLRSALDQLAWQLALLVDDDPPPGTRFPIFLDRQGFERERRGAVKAKLSRIPPEPAAAIERLQPYNLHDRPAGAVASTDPLWILRELDREARHRVVRMYVASFTCTLRTTVAGQERALEQTFTGPLEDGAEVWETPIPGAADADVHVEADLAPEIAFAEPLIAWARPVLPTLTEIGSRIETVVVPELRPFLTR